MGLLRIALALSVIAGHANTTVFGLSWVNKFYAVQAFFVISGFYMSMVLNEKYGSYPVGVFYVSRALRIYPNYLISIIAMIAINRSAIKATLSNLPPISKLLLIGQNLVILGQDLPNVFCLRNRAGACTSSVDVTINPPAWSLSVELGFYLIAPFVVRSPARIIALIGVGTLYHLVVFGMRFPIANVDIFINVDADMLAYYFYPSSFIFFGAGALAYHATKLTIHHTYVLLIAFFVAFGFIPTLMPAWHLFIFPLALPELFRLTRNNRVDRLIGELSYPVYVLHWPILTLLQHRLTGNEWFSRYISLGSIVALASCAGGAVLYALVDRRIARFRHLPGRALETTYRRKSTAARLACVFYVTLPLLALAAMNR